MKQIRLFLILVLTTQYGFGQDCSIEKSLSNDVSICIGQSVIITLSSSENGVSYQLRDDFDDSDVESPVLGDGNDITFTISPTSAKTYNVLAYTSTPACSNEMDDLITITVTNLPFLNLATANDNQDICINTSLTDIVYNVGNVTDVLISNLPTGVTGNYDSTAGTFTISGTPSVAGIFNYTVTTSGGCSPDATANGSITVRPSMAILLSSGNDNQTVCINTSIADITYNVGDATSAYALGLPAGVTGSYNSGTGVFTISGTPTVSGPFNYTVSTSGGCLPSVSLGGTITVTPAMAITLNSGSTNQTVCINTSIANIAYNVGNSASASASGLPAGVTGSYNAGTGIFTISGTPTVSGPFNYTVSTSGGCLPVASLGGTITVTPAMVISSLDDEPQIICINSSIIPIHYTVSNATGVTVNGLPPGVTGSYAGGVFTISGTSSVTGTFNYTVSTTGGCSPAASMGSSITVQPLAVGGTLTDSSGYNPATVCYSSPTGTLNLAGKTGNVVTWERSTDGGVTWSSIAGTANLITYNYAGLTVTTLFRVSVRNGILCPDAKSNIVLVNVIPNIKPSPVVASPSTICNGGSSVLSAVSGYATSQNLATGGTFNDANPSGWLSDGCVNCLNSGSSNTNENAFALSATNGGTYSGINCTSTGKFAIVHGDLWGAPYNGTSRMETPVFSTLGLSTATFQFTHAYRLYPGANIKVELSLNGGSTYPVTLYTQTGGSPYTDQGPFSPFTTVQSFNLNAYIGQPNLKIRFTYFSNNTDSLWAIDDIKIPDIPVNITTQWVDGGGNVVATGLTYSVSPTVTTIYGVRSSFIINGTSTCISSGSAGTSYVTVTVIQRPTASIGPSQTICNNTPATFSIALTGVAPWTITYNDGTASTTVTTSSNPYIFNTPNLIANTTYRITALSDANCTSIPGDFPGNANVNVLNGTPGLWTGLKDTEWFDCMNWAGGGPNPPSITTDVLIPSGSPNMPNINAATAKAIPYSGIANARDITITGGASLTMTNASTINIGKDWKNSGTFNSGNGTVVFAGSTLNQIQYINQSIKNNEQFYNLSLNVSGGAKGIILPNAFQLTVANNLTLQSGDLRLTDEAQLVQNGTSSNPLTGTGRLFRDQQGKKSSFHYTYWSSPVSLDNVNYTISGIMKDGTDVTTDPFATTGIVFGEGIYFADGPATTPIKISNRWLYKFSSTTNSYSNWQKIYSNSLMKIGEGYIMKGCDGTVTPSAFQNFVFAGKPNNGDINVVLGTNQTYLVGNPYPSALDADKFIRDNLKDCMGCTATSNKFNGALYFWDHFGGTTHYLAQYVGGYATYTLMGGVVAVSNDPLAANNGATGSKVPKKYVPVAQGFFIHATLDPNLTANNPNLATAITGGTVNFKNSQRAFMTEGSGNSVMMRVASNGNVNNEYQDARKKIRIQYISSIGISRQLLVGADENASDNFDLGYDAPMIDVNKDDAYWSFENGKFIIQAVSNFDAAQRIGLAVVVENSGASIFKLAGLENIPKETPVYLYDDLMQVYYNLQDSEVALNLEKGEYLNRFSIRFEKAALNNDDVSNDKFLIYYSKNDTSLNIENGSNVILKKIHVFNVLGQTVMTSDMENSSDSHTKINLSKISKATYIVKLIAENGVVTKKFIKE
ncbi:T9SS type A sorting domain-containing protein [Flavobacterium sp. H122]|uniref:T9SS type A sorting domain-containing protein n=1 Tax=Flavobacterium sp. H122 TaxID=2529860 RepID=UPI0010A9A9E7|nr:T9SS type A sorting domain-containing protein [Flavobacterium sp. H122]